VETKNLDGYGQPPIPWSRPRELLEHFESGPGTSVWLATTRPDGRPHVTGIGAIWFDDRFWFVSGPGTRKSRNLVENPNVAISVGLPGLDLVVEGTAARVTDKATLERVVAVFRDQGWPAEVEGDGFTAPFNAPSAGPPPWHLYEVTAKTAYGVASDEPHGASRWRFDR
jgi:hypothetical protein